MPEAWIIDAVRTPMGRAGGQLAGVRPDDLAAVPLRAILERTGVAATEVEDVFMGCANQGGEDCRNVARMALLLAGARVVVAMMTHTTAAGEPKLVTRLTLPLTSRRPADWVVTELATFRRDGEGLALVDLEPGVPLEMVRARTAARFEVRLPP